MKKTILACALCASLASTEADAGAAAMTPSGGGNDTAVVVLVVALAALIFSAGRSRGRAAAGTTKSPDSQF